MAKPDQVIIDGVRYVPVSESSPAAAAFMKALASAYWGKDAPETDDPKEYRDLAVIVTDDTRQGGMTIEQFAARYLP